MYDTSKDPRMLVAQFACAMLKKCVKQKPGVQLGVSRGTLDSLASACESSVMALTYMYQAPEALAASDTMSSIEDATRSLTDAYERMISKKDDRSMLRANIRWCFRTLRGLGARLGNSGATVASGVDIVTVLVRSVVPDGDFRKTRVTDGDADYTVMTNLDDVESGTTAAVVFLPPREIGSTVSEAMFLGSETRAEPPGTILAEEAVDAKEAAGILYEELQKRPK